ncbi:MAG: cobalamin biosynthesis protein [Clostridioides difficile]|nr:cobalamin biosynthesis protein [Clostridioides sp.]MBS5788336.1 cobalamin biosynthesis protein [Clostridioides difficile]
MKSNGMYPASCGELVQGLLGDTEYLCSYAVDLFSHVVLEEKIKNIKKVDREDVIYDLNNKSMLIDPDTEKSRRALEKVFDKFSLPIKDTYNITIDVFSSIPTAKGMASSTADIGATIMAALALINKKMRDEEIAKLAAEIEPTDSTLLKQNCIFDPLTGRVERNLGFLEKSKVVVLEPDEVLLTSNTRGLKDYKVKKEANRRDIEAAFSLLANGFEDKNLKLIGQACNISSLANENIHKKAHLEKLMEISDRYGGYGVNVAHSGTVVGILLDENIDESIIIDRIVRENINSVYKDIYTLKIITGGAKGDKDGLY